MMQKDRGIFGKTLCLFFFLSSVILVCSTCSTDTSRPERDGITSESGIPENSSLIGITENVESRQDPSSFTSDRGGDDQITPALNMIDEVRQLWYAGYYEDARQHFDLKPDVKNDEWRLWRGKLFIEQWEGSELGLAGENISALLSDKDDIWAGTWTGGLVRFSEPLGTYTVWDPGLPSLAVRTVNRILSDGKTISVVRYASIENYNKRTGEWHAETGLPATDRLQDLCIIGKKTYLATLGYGLWEKTVRGWSQIDFPGLFINRLEQGAENELLIATMDRGLFILDTESGSWIQPPQGKLRASNITSLIRSGVSIVGGTYGDGAFIWNTVSSEVNVFGRDILGDPWVLSVIEEGNRYIFGTFGAGLNILNEDFRDWDRISLQEGLKSADIASLTEDDSGNIWAGTLGGGIIRISGSIYGD